jgi:transposase
MSEIRRTFDPEFREGAVRIVWETGKPITQVARELGIDAGTLGNWVASDRAESEGMQGLSTDDAAELKRLRTEVAELRMERDVHVDLFEIGWTVSVNTVADSMRRQGLQGRKPKRRKGLTRQDKAAPTFADLLAATSPRRRRT